MGSAGSTNSERESNAGSFRSDPHTVQECRDWCGGQSSAPIIVASGGYYFSPLQAVWIDALRAALPSDDPARTVALAALIRAASQCNQVSFLLGRQLRQLERQFLDEGGFTEQLYRERQTRRREIEGV
jgi:four helix bundle suffix protein